MADQLWLMTHIQEEEDKNKEPESQNRRNAKRKRETAKQLSSKAYSQPPRV